MARFLDMAEFGEAARFLRLTNLEQLAAKAQAFDGKSLGWGRWTSPPSRTRSRPCCLSGTKRVWMPDDVEAYAEVEIRELNGDKTTVETKDGRVGSTQLEPFEIL